MPSLERFINPQTRPFSLNVTPMPGARLYFFGAGSSTPKVTYADKEGAIPNSNPVVADSTGSFPPIFLDGLYRVELRSAGNIVQAGWPIDSVGQDRVVVPFGEWNETFTYPQYFPVTGSNGNWYRSLANGNLGNDPVTSPADWETVAIPVASSFTSNKSYITFSDDVDQISLDLDVAGLTEEIEANINEAEGDFSVGGNMVVAGTIKSASNLFAIRTTIRSIASQATPQIDPDLTISNVPAGVYHVRGHLSYSGNGTTSNGISVNLAVASGGTIRSVMISAANNAPGTPAPADSEFSIGTPLRANPITGGPTEPVVIDAIVESSGGSTFRIDWAQQSSNVISTVVTHAFISATKIN